MAKNLVEEEIHRQVREQLNKEKVKLWLPPHTKEDGSRGEQPQVRSKSALVCTVKVHSHRAIMKANAKISF